MENMQLARFNGEVIKERRMQLGLTRKEVCRQLDIGEETLKKWEEGARVPTADSSTYRLLQYLNLTVREVTQYSDSITPTDARTMRIPMFRGIDTHIVAYHLRKKSNKITKEEVKVTDRLADRLIRKLLAR